ncbi:MAG: amidohydrolase [Acidobacteria bacterium]|nr:amidohydrolase [Acidobacteriota bacterium]MCI0623342.1 amidohydrolase [Acidobacteriota bacterium]MCI0717649.1 amidohydrolase [Acidobacteriota bacterium]
MQNLSRRQFLGAACVFTLAHPLSAQDAPEPILDLHQHTPYNKRPRELVLVHQEQHRIKTTVILPGEGWMLKIIGGNRECADFQAAHSDRYVKFTSADPAESRALDVLRGNIQRGAIGIGEMKYHVAVDSPEMHRVYKLAEEMQVPVLLHFEYEMYNTGFERFDKVLKAYPKVNFIGHAQTWWGNVSADLKPLDLYPKGRVKPGGLTDRLLSDYANIYADLSAGSGLNAMTRDPEFYRGFIERHSRKLIWGSDCDCNDGKGAGVQSGRCLAEQSLELLRKLTPDMTTYRRIVYGNGAGLLKLK